MKKINKSVKQMIIHNGCIITIKYFTQQPLTKAEEWLLKEYKKVKELI